MTLPRPPPADSVLSTSSRSTFVYDAHALAPLIASTFVTPSITFWLNGQPTILKNPNPQWTLLDYLRSRPSLRGTKLGCGEGGCGACTVVMQDGQHNEYRRHILHLSINACLFPLVGCDGKHIITIEGIGSVAHPHPLQERVAKMHGSQCGFCTPGIVMSLYALVRNAWDPEAGVFRLSEKDVEREGALDGNLCRCTGYKTILEAAKTFVTEDLKGIVDIGTDGDPSGEYLAEELDEATSEMGTIQSPPSCGRPGGCCPDDHTGGSCCKTTDTIQSPLSDIPRESRHSSPLGNSDNDDAVPSSSSSVSTLDEEADDDDHNKTGPLYKAGIQPFRTYSPGTELIYPPALWKYEQKPICYGDESTLWFRPTTLSQILQLKSAYPPAKLVSGSSEITIEQRIQGSEWPVLIYVGNILSLQGSNIPAWPASTDGDYASFKEVHISGNTPLTEVERICKEGYARLGRRGTVLEALRRQLRYFGGRQIRNVATLAGNISTASPISDTLPVLMAAGARLTVARVDGESGKEVGIEMMVSDFIKGYRKTALTEDMPDGVITNICIPLTPSHMAGKEVLKAYKQAKRKEDDIAIVSTCFRVRLDDAGRIDQIGLAYGGMAPTTILAFKTQSILLGRLWADQSTLDAAIESLHTELHLPYDVPGGMAQYRTTLACSLFLRFWHESLPDLGLVVQDAEVDISELERGLSRGIREIPSLPLDVEKSTTPSIGKPVPHLSALAQTTGKAEYIDDIPPQYNEVFGGLVLSRHAHAHVLSVDWTPALSMPGVVGYVDRHSLSSPDINQWGSQKHDEPFFAEDTVVSHGQIIGMVLAESQLQARTAARRVQVIYEDLPAIITIDDAINAESFFEYGRELRKGDAALNGKMDELLGSCDRVFEGTTRIGGQEQFYLETNAALAVPKSEDGQIDVWSSTQNTMETQLIISQILSLPSHKINVRVKRLGGGFGGKESRSVPIACYCALAASLQKRPVRIMLTREEDMMTTGQRHPIMAKWRVGVTQEGKLLALEADVYNNAGFSLDMSASVMDRCLTHIDNCYEIPHVWVRGHVCRTNTHSNTAFRGFGAPQGMYFTESILSAVAEGLGMSVDELRMKNLYTEGHKTPFLQEIDEDWHIPTILEQLRRKANFNERKRSIDIFNSNPKNKWKKRGIAMIPTKFGLSFATALHLNQASACVQLYTDGTVLLSHGGTEMGQGLYTKMCQVAASELGIPLRDVYTADSSTYSITNASPTAASSGSDLNGMAVKIACEKLVERLRPYREELGDNVPMKDIAMAAYKDRISLIATGFWKMPRVGYIWGNYKDPKPMYYYWTQGVGISEVELDILTGDHTVLRTDIMMDIGRSINPALDYGQIEGAFVQGQGLFTLEESLWNSKTGCLATTGPGAYKIPGFGNIPQEFNVSMLKYDSQGKPISWKHLRSIASSKGVGEPPLFMGSTVFFALREAVRAARMDNGLGNEALVLDSPATVESLRCAVGDDMSRKYTSVTTGGELKPFFIRAS